MIENGDRVSVIYKSEHEPAETIDGTVLNMPRSEGDLLHIETDLAGIIAINPYHRDFERLIKLPAEKLQKAREK